MKKLMPLPLFKILLFIVLFSGHAQAATVKAIVKEKYIAIDAGTDQGFNQKSRICFFENETRVACGIVVQARANRSFARVSDANLKKIKKGLEVRLYEGSSKTAKTEAAPGSEASSEKSKEKDSGKAKGASNIKMAYILTPQAPATYHAISYFAPYNGNGDLQEVSTLWDRDRDIITSAVGFGLELGLGIGSGKLNLGGRMRLYKGTSIRSYYNDDLDIFAETKMSATAFGGWLDYYYLIFDYGKLSIDIGNGLDADISQVNMKMNQKSEVNDTVIPRYDYKSTLTVLSFRTNIVFNLFLDPLGLQFGTFFTFPLTSSSKATATIDDPHESILRDVTAEEDVIDAIDHRAANFGIELFFSAYYAF